MTSRKYRLSRIAEVELLELWTYLFEQSLSEQRADKVIGNIVLKFANLAEFPLRAGLLYQNHIAISRRLTRLIEVIPAKYPGFLVSMAETTVNAATAKSVVPVGKIAEQENWSFSQPSNLVV